MQKLTAILLSFLVLVASSGITIGMHICQGELTGIAVGGPANHCEHSLPNSNNHCQGHCDKEIPAGKNANLADKEHACCEDSVYELDKVDYFQLSSLVSIADQITLLQLLTVYHFPQQSAYFNQPHKRPYSELFIEQDIPVLVQSFLI